MNDVATAIREMLDKYQAMEAENEVLKSRVEGYRTAILWMAKDTTPKDAIKSYVKSLMGE